MAVGIPLLELAGEPYEMGRQHGHLGREPIKHNFKVYFRRFERWIDLPRREVLRRARSYLEVIEDQYPAYAEAMHGVADGAECSLLDIAVLNVRYELMYSEFSRMELQLSEATVDHPYGCTAFAVMPEASDNGHLLMGQNWDWIPQVAGLFLKIEGPDGLRVLCFTEAGIVGGKIGLNSAGLGLAVNGLVSDSDDWSHLGKPFHVRCWEILNSRTLEDATHKAVDGPSSCSANFLLGQAAGRSQGRVVDLETSPNGVCSLRPQKGLLAHTNHFFDPGSADVHEPQEERQDSMHRCERMEKLLRRATEGGSKLDITAVQTILRDHEGHPDSICRHPSASFPEEAQYQTVTSVILDLHAKKLWTAQSPPCQSSYRALSLRKGS
ncbi:MAG: C45 family autoproteolytic acyltransferase/hydrolase [Candidatus Geothermarchaeales archaeon]